MMKKYSEPEFKLVLSDESNAAFLAASGTPGTPISGGSFKSLVSANGSW